MAEIRVTTPLDDSTIMKLRSGDKVLITGTIYTGRDSAHKRLVELIDKGGKLPIDVKGQIIYYVGPTPTKPGDAVGSAGPTTSERMDAYSPKLLKMGLKGMIGKGGRSGPVIEAMKENRAVYMAATGGAGALISKCIKSSEIVAYEDLGPEAIRKMEVVDFPVIVINDVHGNDLYAEGAKKYSRTD